MIETPTNNENATVSLKILLLILAVILVGALSYLVWAQNTVSDTVDNLAMTTKSATVSTANWKTYTNSKSAYTLKYPSDWKVTENEVGRVDFTEPFVAAPDPINNPLAGDIGVDVPLAGKHNYADWSIDRFFSYLTTGGTSEREQFEPIPVETGTKELVKVDGTDGYLVKYRVDISQNYGVFVKHGNNFFEIALTARDDYQQAMITKYGPTLRALVATFQFTN